MTNIVTHTDLYQLNMGLTYFKENIHLKTAVFEVYFRPREQTTHHIFAGLDKIIDVIEKFQITDTEIIYLRENLNFPEPYLNYLQNMRFTGTITALNEGEIIYPNTPLFKIKAPLIEGQILETIILNIINYQTLIATKASLMFETVKKGVLVEFGARRAYETEAALYAARSAYIGGFVGTSLVRAGLEFGIPVIGTHSHSFVQAHETEYEAFKNYALTHKNVTFLLDTYDVFKSGLPNALKVAKKYGDKFTFRAIRLDSGDLAAQSKKIRKILDENGFQQTKITVSNDLNIDTIASLQLQGAEIDNWAVGTNLVSSSDYPSLGAVYKLVSIEQETMTKDVMKLSAHVAKMTYPGEKKVYRIYDKQTQIAKMDIIVGAEEKILNLEKIMVYDNENNLSEIKLTDYNVRDLQATIYQEGEKVYADKTIQEIADFSKEEKMKFSKENLRSLNPEYYEVCFSEEIIKKQKKIKEEYASRNN